MSRKHFEKRLETMIKNQEKELEWVMTHGELMHFNTSLSTHDAALHCARLEDDIAAIRRVLRLHKTEW